MSNKRAAAIKAPLVGIVRQARGEQLFHRQHHDGTTAELFRFIRAALGREKSSRRQSSLGRVRANNPADAVLKQWPQIKAIQRIPA
jgi:hypothetical protein